MKNEQWELIDILNILSFIIGLLNYNENLTQNDKQDLLSAVSRQTKEILTDIHRHLEEQDKKLDEIMRLKNEKSF